MMGYRSVLVKPTKMLKYFDADFIAHQFRDLAMIAAIKELSPGETLRYQDVEAPFSLIRKLILTFGAKIEMSYIKRHVGLVEIDFLRR